MEDGRISIKQSSWTSLFKGTWYYLSMMLICVGIGGIVVLYQCTVVVTSKPDLNSPITGLLAYRTSLLFLWFTYWNTNSWPRLLFSLADQSHGSKSGTSELFNRIWFRIPLFIYIGILTGGVCSLRNYLCGNMGITVIFRPVYGNEDHPFLGIILQRYFWSRKPAIYER